MKVTIYLLAFIKWKNVSYWSDQLKPSESFLFILIILILNNRQKTSESHHRETASFFFGGSLKKKEEEEKKDGYKVAGLKLKWTNRNLSG